MTVPNQTAHIEYVGDGSTTIFAYNFLITASSQLEVLVDQVEQTESTHYTVSGVGTATGGNVTFLTAPADTSVVSLRRVVNFEQLLDLQANTALPSESVETRLDLIVMMAQQLVEELSRVPGLQVGVSSTLRDLILPVPGASKLFGWNALGTGITLYDSTILTVTPDSVSGLTYAKANATLTPSGGESVLTASSTIPSGARILGVTVRVTTAFGTTNGLTGFDVGGMGFVDGWGSAVALTLGTTTGIGNFNRQDQPTTSAAQDVTLTARGGTFDATGAAKITVHYVTLTPDS